MKIRKREFTEIRKYGIYQKWQNTKTRIYENPETRQLLNYENEETRIYENTEIRKT